MKTIFKTGMAAIALVLAGGISSCSDDNGNGNGSSQDISNPNTGETPVTAEEQKDYIEQTAKQMTEVFKPEDQAEFVDFCRDFAEEFGEFGTGESNRPYNYMVKGITDLGRSAKSINLMGMTRAIQELSYSFGDVSGIYEPDFREDTWVRTGDSKNVEFRFKVKGVNCSLVAEPNGGDWSMSGTGYEEDDDYPYDEHPVKVTVTVPRNITISLTKGSTRLAYGTVDTKYDQKGKTAYADIDMTVANINVSAKADMTNSRVKAEASARIGGTELFSVSGQLNGHDLCDIDKISECVEINDEYDEEDSEFWKKGLHSLFSDGTATANIMRRMFISGKCDNITSLARTFALWYDVEEDKSLAQEKLNYLNSHIKSQFYLGGSKEPTGDIIWSLYRESEDWGYEPYYYWYPEPVMKFSDGTTYRFTEYFNEGNFGSTMQSIVSLVELYQAFFGI